MLWVKRRDNWFHWNYQFFFGNAQNLQIYFNFVQGKTKNNLCYERNTWPHEFDLLIKHSCAFNLLVHMFVSFDQKQDRVELRTQCDGTCLMWHFPTKQISMQFTFFWTMEKRSIDWQTVFDYVEQMSKPKKYCSNRRFDTMWPNWIELNFIKCLTLTKCRKCCVQNRLAIFLSWAQFVDQNHLFYLLISKISTVN